MTGQPAEDGPLSTPKSRIVTKLSAMPPSPGVNVTSRDATWTAVLLVGLGVLLCIRLAALYLNTTDLFFDEAQYWAWSEEPAFGYYSKPPLIAWIIRAATDTCGAGEACVRLPSPFLHTLTALAIFALGRLLYDVRTGVLSALAFATLPGVSLSAGLISTDVPLLLCWALALVGFAELFATRRLWPALLLGIAFGVGLNAKYAMAWFVLCAAIYLFMTQQRRSILTDYRLYLAFALGLLLIVPNLVWNYANSFATFSHTADNANWGGSLVHPVKALEFFASQFGVVGPILFGAFLALVWRAWKTGVPEPDRMLLAFSLPLVAIIAVQALLSRAHANWAAPAYVAATVLVIATMVRDRAWGWLAGSFAVNIAVLALIAFGTSTAGRPLPVPLKPDPFARTLGWHDLAVATREELAKARANGRPFAAVLTDDREVTAELLYYMRGEPTPVLAWRQGAPHDHFELTRPFTAATTGPVLLVRLDKDAGPSAKAFAASEPLGSRMLPAGENEQRRVTFYALSGYKGR
jgi:4-amino-4-deoxy-L-arabinose transferase-like glycosyltransferase